MKIRRLIFSFLALAVLLVLLSGVLFLQSSVFTTESTKKHDAMVLSGISQKLRELDREISDTGDQWIRKNATAGKMMAAALKGLVTEDGYFGPSSFADGFVVRAPESGKVFYPDNFPGYIDGLENLFNGTNFLSTEGIYHRDDTDRNGTKVIITIERIADDYYYVDWTNYNEYVQDGLDFDIQAGNTLRDMERSYDNFFLVVSNKDSSLLYCSSLICTSGNEAKLEDLNLTKEDVSQKTESLTINNNLYIAAYQQVRFLGESAQVIILNPIITNENNKVGLISMTIIFVGVIIVGLILWQFWVQRFVQSHSLTGLQASRYQPAEVRKISAAVALIGAVGIFIFSIFYQSLDNLKKESASDQTSLWLAAEYISTIRKGKTTAQKDQEEWSVYYSERAAELLSRCLELRTKQVLSDINEIVGSEYIMLFDEDGNEIASSNTYEGFQLGTKEDDPTTDFRRLLLGVDSIVHAPQKLPTTEKYSQLTGSRVKLSEDSRKYGAVILAFNSQESWEARNEKSIRDFIKRITQEGHLCAVVEAGSEPGRVIYSSKDDLLNSDFVSMGIYNADRKASDMDHFVVDAVSYYGAFEEIDGNRYYYLTEEQFIQNNSSSLAFTSALGFIICVVLVSLIMLTPYRLKEYRNMVQISEASHLDAVMDSDDSSADAEKEDEFEETGIRVWWFRLLPEMKLRIFLQVVMGLLLIFIVTQIYAASVALDQTVFAFVFRGNWTRGINLLSISAILLLNLGYVIFIFVKSLLIDILKNVLAPKGKTIVHLVASLIQYGAFIGLVFVSLNFLGINTTVMLAGFSAFSLAITLGGQGLVADILAGIFIIFEDDFHVGDLIDVNGFQGIVQDIGVRSTRILGLGDNIKIIGNHDVKNVLNLSRMNTWYTMDFNVPVNQPLPEIEEMLRNELDDIGRSIPEIISGPYYKGVWTIGTNAYVLSVNTECKEVNLRRVRRKLNHALLDLFEKYGYKMG